MGSPAPLFPPGRQLIIDLQLFRTGTLKRTLEQKRLPPVHIPLSFERPVEGLLAVKPKKKE
jgi:hypothetical protein